MRNKSISTKCFRKFLVTLFYSILILLVSFSCYSLNQNLRVSGFRFTFEGNDYFIRSIYCPNSPESCNHLIGKGFEAVDINQDRVIDKVVKGGIAIRQTQIIYDYALNLLEEENKLNAITKYSKEFRYTIKKPNIVCEIISFQPEIGFPFNQFKVVQIRFGMENDISLFNDLNADGSLDGILLGSFSIVEAQKQYQETIEDGLKNNKISRTNNLIRVK